MKAMQTDMERRHANSSRAEEGGIAQVWRLAYPLSVSTASSTIMQVVNRIFLSRVSSDALAACVPAGILSFAFMTFFMGLAGYTNVFVAQHYGGKRYARMSVSLWQGAWLSLLSGAAIAAMLPLGLYIINASGHAPAVKILERQYFAILMLGGWLLPLNSALSSFFTGRGRTKITMAVNLAGNGANILLSWLLIFFLGMGIRGAAYALVAGNAIMAAAYLALILSARNRRKYRTAKLLSPRPDVLMQMLKYGTPNGIGFMLDVASFTVFIFLVGNAGAAALAANNIIFSINMMAFMPVLGIGMAAQTLVGQYIGGKRPDIAVRSVNSAVKLAVLYLGGVALCLLAAPSLFTGMFGAAGDAQFAAVERAALPLIRLLAVFIIFDGIGIIYSDAIRGAGDTRFQMAAATICAWTLFVPPSYYLINKLHAGMELVWLWMIFYVFVVAAVFYFRFRSGKWLGTDITA